MAQEKCVVRGSAFHALAKDQLECLEDCLIEVGADGVIIGVIRSDDPRHGPCLTQARTSGTLRELAQGQYLIPGLVDLHVHAPQWPQLGKALDAPLEVWLQQYTFPLEAKYEDVEFARRTYDSLVTTLLHHGTTTAVYFATVHVEGTLALAQACLEHGQRALVGRVSMDDPDECPDFYRDPDAATSVARTREVIEAIKAMQDGENPLVLPVITPRFLPSCSEEALKGLGELAAETGCHVQTHCSESDWEVGHTASRFGASDVEVLDRFGLLAPHTVLAHSNFVNASDRARMRAKDAAIAHCPLSNFYFAGAVAPVRQALDEGVRIGLGTDISGGHSAFLFDSARMAMAASRALDRGVDPEQGAVSRGKPGSSIDVVEAFWLATRGGGEALGLPIGTFEPGQAFDALAIDTQRAGSALSVAPDLDTAAEILEKILRCAMPTDIATVWVNGRIVVKAL